MGVFIGWIFFSFLVGIMGGERKIGFGGAFALALFLSPLIGLIFTALSKSKADMRREAEMLALQQQQAEALQEIKSHQPQPSHPEVSLPADPQARINRLRELRDTGAITQDEFLALINKSVS